MDAPSKLIVFVGGIFLSIMLLGLGVFIWNQLSDGASASLDDYSQMEKEMLEGKYSLYENNKSRGSQVVNAIRKFKEDGNAGNIGIQVKTNKNQVGKWYYGQFTGTSITTPTGDLKLINDTTALEYINPSGMFKAEIQRDDNEVIRAIVFSQQ